jgi:hypothetical protein
VEKRTPGVRTLAPMEADLQTAEAMQVPLMAAPKMVVQVTAVLRRMEVPTVALRLTAGEVMAGLATVEVGRNSARAMVGPTREAAMVETRVNNPNVPTGDVTEGTMESPMEAHPSRHSAYPMGG